jgi:hypothetical protein
MATVANNPEEGSSWLGSACQWAVENPVTAAKAVVGVAVATQLYRWGILGEVTQPITNGTYFGVPVSIASTAAVIGVTYMGYEAGKTGVVDLAKVVKNNPLKSAVAACSLYQTGLGSIAANAAWNAATTSAVMGTVAFGFGVDYAKACINEKTPVPKTVNTIIDKAKDPVQTFNDGKAAVAQMADDTIDKIVPIATKVYDHSIKATALGAAVSGAALWLGLPYIATGLAIATVVPAVFTYMKHG